MRSEKKRLCFVISPFGGWSDVYYQELIRPAIESAGFLARRADDLFSSSDIVGHIWSSINDADVLLADLTGKNPNVFYELGLAHAARKPVLLLSQTIDDVPFDLRGLRVELYDIRNPKWGEKLSQAITNGLQETDVSADQFRLPTFLLQTPDRQLDLPEDAKFRLDVQRQLDRLRSQITSLERSRPATIGLEFSRPIFGKAESPSGFLVSPEPPWSAGPSSGLIFGSRVSTPELVTPPDLRSPGVPVDRSVDMSEEPTEEPAEGET